MPYTISKEFPFCYGHRVHNQQLIEGLSEDMTLACRHLHGHQGNIVVDLSSDELTRGMVTDFKHLGFFKRFVDDHLDHKMILDINDPILDTVFFVPNVKKHLSIVVPCIELGNDRRIPIPSAAYQTVDVTSYTEEFEKMPGLVEILEGLVFVDFVPTSENLSHWLYNVVNDVFTKQNIGVTVTGLHFSETPKSHATYSRG